MTVDAFEHLPALRGKLTPAEQSRLRPTWELLAQWDERARTHGLPPDWRLPNELIESTRRALLAEHGAGRDLWVYGYGSLMWDPGVHFAEVRLARLQGFRRCFCLRSTLGRGSREQPALMLALERGGGACTGLAFRLAASQVEAESAMLWRREMLRGGYTPALLPMSTPQGEITALAMTANAAHPDYVGELPLEDTAAMIAGAVGLFGSNRDYLEQLAGQLETLGLDDPYVRQLRQRVRAIAGPPLAGAAPG
ncbi:MAG: gamma-glutamylcyclotransferase [Ideonella sp.]|nr:MAG: gamma-glutamylcyclotransferase [Burkholderiaceae bacterium]MBE7426637.1 gamma-glutamylcyclotransferase [Ideonella sp.]